ncbi:uncharacterized protein LOC117604995 [Osmia lignaria lignaria]|nr:uncharacterized protein LOC117604995 isoform X2 [Osmia lignaria]
MIGRLRVPPCFIKTPFPGKSGKIAIITWKDIKKNWVLMPLVLIKICVLTSAALLAAHRLFWTTIDVRLYDYYRFEIPPVPRFFDLRNPRPLKLVKLQRLCPAIHLDNRYRLMRHEPMLDADGKETKEIGKDESAPPNMKDAFEKILKKEAYYGPPKIK